MTTWSSVFYRRKKPSLPLSESGETADASEMLQSQSARKALLAAFVMGLLCVLAFAALADFFQRVFPWFVIVQGVILGLAVRRYGYGFDWRFPVIAAMAALLAAYLGNFYLAAGTTAMEFDTSIPKILAGVTSWTVGTFFAEAVTPADHVFAIYSALLAAFLSRRRLSRAEVHALRTRHNQSR